MCPHGCFMMPLLSPMVTLFLPSAIKDIMKVLERTLMIDEVIINRILSCGVL